MRKKLIISTGLLLLIASVFALGVFAASDIKLFINGKSIDADIQIVNGSSYVPLRVVSESLGGTVKWDGDARTINITSGTPAQPKPTPQSTAAPTPSPLPTTSNIGSTRSNPVESGVTLNYTTNHISENYTASISVDEIIRGDDAWKNILAANKFNSPPDDGYEYILAKINFKLLKNFDINHSANISNFDFKLVSSDGKDYDNALVVAPDPQYKGNLYEGASQVGWAVFKVRKDDLHPLIAFDRSYDGSGGIWFKADATVVGATPTPTPIPATTILNNKSDLQTYLESNYSTAHTSIGDTKFTFMIIPNDTTLQPYDYSISFLYDATFFYDMKYSNKYTEDQRTTVKNELKSFMEKAGQDLISKFPGKKFTANYYNFYYDYPSIQVGYHATRYLTWTNYDEPPIGGNEYAAASASTFRWYSFIDDSF